MSLADGARVGHYEILEPIGKGGMGEVYRAHDTTLDRDVALKVLPAEVADDPGRRERFEREALAVAALNHPNIVTIHSVEAADGVRFLTLELVEGDTLDRVIPDDGLPLERFLAIARPLVSGLAAAHDKGITHRDLKPSNVMVGSDGRIKVLDFGLAKLDNDRDSLASIAGGSDASSAPTVPRDERSPTKAGTILGTAPYMSPEQVDGKPVDARSDVFSLGTVLYEMATGRRPFRGDSPISVMSSILKDAPSRVGAHRGEFPREVSELVARCLEKRPENRFANGAAVSEALIKVPNVTRTEDRRPFVGRETERAELDRLLDRVADGQGGLVLMGGEPGVGKTRLAEEVLADARERGHATLVGRNYEEEAGPFIPLVEMLERLAETVPPERLREALGDYAPDIARLTPELRRRFPDLPEPAELPPEVRRRYLFNGLLELLRHLSRDDAYVLLLDDLHWADDASLALVEHVAPHLASLPLVMLGTYRDVELEVGKPFEKTLATLVRQRLATRLAIRRLPEASVGELLGALSGEAPPPALVTAIFHETEGNPFFVEEVFAHLSEEGKLFDADGKWKTGLTIDELEVPEGVRLVIGRRLERLSEDTPKVLTTAALVGRRFELALVEAVANLGDEQVLDAIEEAEAAKLVRPDEDSRGTSYSFTHELIRQTLMSSLSLPRRQRLHLKVAAAIESVHPRRLDEHAAELGRHLYLAGGLADITKTVRYLDTASEQAFMRGAYEEALQHCEDALSLLDGESELLEERADLVYRRALANQGRGARKEMESDLEKAFELNERLGRTEALSRVCSDAIFHLAWDGRWDEMEDHVARGLAAAGDEDSPARCRLLSRVGLVRGLLADPEPSLRFADEAFAMSKRLDDPRLTAMVWCDRITDLLHANLITQTVDEGELALETQQKMGAKWDRTHTAIVMDYVWFGTGQLDRLEQEMPELQRVARQLSYYGEHSFMHFEAMARAVRGRRDAMAPIHRLLELEGQVGLMFAEPTALAGLLELWHGRRRESNEMFEDSQTRAIGSVWQGWAASHRLTAMAYGEDEGTLDFLNEHRDGLPIAGQLNPGGRWPWLLATIEALACLGERRQAAALYPLVPELLQTGAIVTIGAGLGLVEKTAGIAAAAGEQWEQAERHFERAANQAEAISHRIDQADVRRWWAWMLLDRDTAGDRGRARELLGRAREIYDELGMPIHLKISRELLESI